MKSVAVLGAGNWGTVLAHLTARNGCDVLLWTRDAARAHEINTRRTNERSSPGLTLAPGVRAVTALRDAIVSAELVIVAIPSQAFREVCRAACQASRALRGASSPMDVSPGGVARSSAGAAWWAALAWDCLAWSQRESKHEVVARVSTARPARSAVRVVFIPGGAP